MYGMSAYPGRWLVTLGYLVWVASVLYVVACLVAPSVFSDFRCELIQGSSIYGEPSRSWLPPGTTCTWELDPYGRYVLTPSPVRLVVVVMALTGFPLLRYLDRLLRRQPLVDA